MRRFDLLALLGVIALSSNGFFINEAKARELAEVTLGDSPFGPGWMVPTPEHELDDKHDPIDFDPLTEGNNDDGEDDDDEGEDDGEDDGEDNGEDDGEDEDEDDEDIVSSPNPDVGGTGDENPFEVLEEMYTNFTNALTELEERVATLTELQVSVEAL